MKQNISINQLNELSDKAKEKLREWWKPQYGDLIYGKWYAHPIVLDYDRLGRVDIETLSLPLLSIGQMIELISDYEYGYWRIYSGKTQSEWYVESNNLYGESLSTPICTELSDTLWEAVKYILEKE